MLIEIPEISDKKLSKLINKLNDLHAKGKMDKFEGQFEELFSYLKNADADQANLILYILSIIFEEYPEYLKKNRLGVIQPYCEDHSEKEILNATGIFGLFLLNNKIESNMDELNQFVDYLKQDNSDIRKNICYFLEQLEENLDTIFLTKVNLFLYVLEHEEEEEVLMTTKHALLQAQKNMTLGLLTNYISEILRIFSTNISNYKRDLIFDLLAAEIPQFSKYKSESKTKILQRLENRIPISRIYNIQEIAKGEGLSPDEVEDNLLSEIEDTEFLFKYHHKQERIFIEFEKEKLVAYFNRNKRSVDEILTDLKDIGVTSTAILSALIKKLLSEEEIEGELTQLNYYPYNFLISDFTLKLQKDGMLNTKELMKYLSKEIVFKVIEEISTQGSFNGVFDKDRIIFYTFRKITEEIERKVSKSNIVDLSPYKAKFSYEDFLKIENFCQQHFFTSIHQEHTWLTNLGKTRIEMELRERQQIGIFDIEESAQNLGIPGEILRKAIKGAFLSKNGFWNKEKDRFYFSKQIKIKINEIQNETNPEKRQRMIDFLSEELQIDKEEIEKKVDEKLEKIAKVLSSKDEFLIKDQLRELQMDYNELIEFVESMGKPYLIYSGKIIFDEKRIKEEKDKIKERIVTKTRQVEQLSIEKLSRELKCAQKMVEELIDLILDEAEINLIKLDEDKFLTQRGLESRIFESKGYLDIKSIIPERAISSQEIESIEKVVLEFIETGKLKGNYDPENKVFQSSDFIGDISMDKEREWFEKEITLHLEEYEVAFNMLKEILMGKEITPSDIDSYEQTLSDTIKKILATETTNKRSLNNANRRLKRLFHQDEPKTRKRGRGRSRNAPEPTAEEAAFMLENDDTVKKLLRDFDNWKTLIIAIEQKAGQIVYLKKKIKANPDDEESKNKLKGIYEYLAFVD